MLQEHSRWFSPWQEGPRKLSQKKWGFKVDPDRLVKANNAGKSISKRNSWRKKGRLEHRIPKRLWWETKLCWGSNSKPKHLVLILNERERGGRLHPYWALIDRWQSRSTPLNVSIVKDLGWMVSLASSNKVNPQTRHFMFIFTRFSNSFLGRHLNPFLQTNPTTTSRQMPSRFCTCNWLIASTIGHLSLQN